MSKKIITLLLIATMLTSMTACSGGTTTPDSTTGNTTAEVTTPESTTAEPTTTQEPTTEEPTTLDPIESYEFKGTMVTVSIQKKDFFNEMVIEKGTKIYLNDVYDGTTSKEDVYRGNMANRIIRAIWKEYEPEKIDEFKNKYFEVGVDVAEITLDQNAVIEYNGDHKWYFYYVGDDEEFGMAVFDVYEVE